MANKSIRSLSSRKGLEYNLFEEIAEISKNDGTETDYHQLSKKFFLDDSVVLGTASFYDFIKPEERNKQIRVCNGTACMVAGSQDQLHSLLHTHFEKEKIGHVACVGHCHTNGAIMYQDKTYSIGSQDQLEQVLSSKAINTELENTYHIGANTTPILTGGIDDVKAIFSLAPRVLLQNDRIIEELKL